jgi:hypothetical protein
MLVRSEQDYKIKTSMEKDADDVAVANMVHIIRETLYVDS